MGLDRILAMVMNIVIRRLINMAISFGMRSASRYGKGDASPGTSSGPAAAGGQRLDADAAKRARIAARNLRRLGR